VSVRIEFQGPGYSRMAQLFGALQQAHVNVREMSIEPGEDDADTVHLSLKLPRSLDSSQLLTLIAGLSEIRSVKID